MKKKITRILSFVLTVFLVAQTNAQVGIGTDQPNSILDITSTTEGLLIPRMTASQGEAIETPNMGELIYALTDEGTFINAIGFWYFDGLNWRPFAAESQNGQNIYNSDGTLLSNRTVTLNGKNLFFGTDNLSLNSDTQRIGIGNDAPEYSLDVNGNVRVRNTTSGNVVALANGVLAIGPKFAYGTVKESLRTSDHNGWYRLNGRAINALPEPARSNAQSMGLTILVNSNNNLMKQGTPLTTSGTQSISLVRTNLPNYTMSATTTSNGGHTHSYSTPNSPNVMESANGNAFVVRAGRGTIQGTATVNTSSSGAHSHTGNIPSGGTGEVINILPERISYSYFIYLGQ